MTETRTTPRGERRGTLRVLEPPRLRLGISTGALYPTPTEEAPDIARVIITRPGQTDTLFDRPTEDLRGLMNLRSVDSLLTFEPGEQIQLRVELRTTDPALFLAGVDGAWADITAGDVLGDGTVIMPSDTGYHHLNVEVLPTAGAYYRDEVHGVALWAIPVRVVGP